jgi:hypothetical protein
VVLVACAMAATPPDWRARDLGGFTLHTPADMQLRAGGADSQAGTLTSGSLRIDYDFGLYADPLVQREDALDYQSGAAIVDGMSARQVHFRLQDAAGQSRSCIGVHVPQVRQSGTGPLSLTMLACADKADDLKDVPAMFASIRITGSRSR